MGGHLGFICAGGGGAGVGVNSVTTPPPSWIGYSRGSYEKKGTVNSLVKFASLIGHLIRSLKPHLFETALKRGLKLCPYESG